MGSLDWVLLCIGLFCALRGIWRGAIAQVFSIVGLVCGFLLASHFYLAVAEKLSRAFPDLGAAQGISFAVLFLLTWFCLAVCGAWLARLFRKTGLGFVDRIWGLILGCLKALLAAIVIVSGATLVLPPESPLLRQSKLTPYVYEAARIVVEITPKQVRDLFNAKREQLMEYWKERNRTPKEPKGPPGKEDKSTP
ncbi:MAG: CvpA family protein [Syntrophobacteraceae bacterium]